MPMASRSRTELADLVAYRHRHSGEVGIGAYARRQRRRNWLIAAFGLALLVGAGWLYTALRQTPSDPRDSLQQVIKCHCISCGFEGEVKVDLRESWLCPQCGQRGLRELWRCDDCGNEFTPTGEALLERCPNCGSQRVGAAPPTQP